MAKKLTQEEFINRCLKCHPEYDYSKTIYVNANTDLIVTCPTHGDFTTRPSRFIMGAKCGCSKCNRGFLKDSLTQDTFIQRCKQHFPNYDYSRVNYIDQYKKVLVTCDKHNYTWKVIPKDLMNGHGCPICGKENSQKKQSLGLSKFIERSNEIHDGQYNYSKVEYINAATKVIIICPEHEEFQQTPHNHLQGQGCPKCKLQPKGERIIEKYLNTKNIKYLYQYEIPYLDNLKGVTKIDFYIPQYNLFIEYNGEQHYKPIKYFGGQLKFEKQLQRDEYVRQYCKDNNIRLIEIKYNENLIKKLDNELDDKL